MVVLPGCSTGSGGAIFDQGADPSRAAALLPLLPILVIIAAARSKPPPPPQGHAPIAVTVDANGNLFVAYPREAQVPKLDAATGRIRSVAGKGLSGFSGDGGLATGACFSDPVSVAVDSSGNLFVADRWNHRIRKVDAGTGIITTVAGKGTHGFSGDDGPAVNAQLHRPRGIAIDRNGNLFIADEFNHRVRRIVLATGLISTVPGTAPGDEFGPESVVLGASIRQRLQVEAAEVPTCH